MQFQEALTEFLNGDFSRLTPLFQDRADGSPCQVIAWYDAGLFAGEPKALDEVFTCACFNGCTNVVEYLLAQGVNPSGGIETGLNAFHWAANRGQLEVVELLIRHKAPLETLNMYGGTVLGCTVWSAVFEPRFNQVRAIEMLLEAGANVGAAEFPSGSERVDEILGRYGAGA